jgi:type I restriction enzyme S subunit
MEVRKGYKKTEVGVIPEDWDCIEFGDCVISSRLGGNYANDVTPSQFPLIKMGNIGRGNIILEKIEYVKNEVPNEKDRLNYGDLLFNTRNTLELVGKVAIWKNELPKAYYNSNLLHFVFDESYVASSFFINYMFNSKLIIDKLKEIATGTTSVAAIYSRDLYKIIIPIPPLSEQQAIAAALSDVDNLISSLTKLINKKINIKQGVMQELLTGKKRLEGFDDKWVEVELGDICEIKKGQMITEKEIEPGKVPVIAGGKQPAYYHRYANRKGKTITISASGANAGYVSFHQEPIFASDCSTIEESKNYDIIFIFSALLLKQPEIYNAQTGGAQPHIHPRDLKPLRVLTPSNVEEQTSIASILSDMDAEIEALEQKLNKYKAIKQGMMHELLTGRIRLI